MWYKNVFMSGPNSSKGIKFISLGELGTLTTGFPTHRLRGEIGAALPLVNVKDLERIHDESWQLSPIMVPDSDRVEKYRVGAGDIIVTARGASLKSGLIPSRWNGAIISSNLIAIRLNEKLRPEILLVFLQSAMGQQAIERRLSKSKLLNVTLRDLSEIEVPVPPMSEQTELAELISIAQLQFEEAIHVAEVRRKLAHSIVLNKLRGDNTEKQSGG